MKKQYVLYAWKKWTLAIKTFYHVHVDIEYVTLISKFLQFRKIT
jgi:hypothetical protein